MKTSTFITLAGVALLSGCWGGGSHLDSPYSLPSVPLDDNQKLEIDDEVEKTLAAKPTLAILYRLAWHRNPSIQAARFRWRSRLEKIIQVESYPDPVISYQYYAEEVETRVGPQKQAFGVSQKIPFPGKLSLKGAMADRDVAIARLATERTIRNVLAQLNMAYSELHFLDRARDIYRRHDELIRKYVAHAGGEAGQGKVNLSESFRAQSFLAQVGYDRLLLKDMREAVVQEIRSICTLPLSTSLGPTTSPPTSHVQVTFSNLVTWAEKHSEEVNMAREKVKKAQSNLNLAWMSYLPDFQISAKYIQTGVRDNVSLPDNGKDPVVIGGGIKVPLWYRKNAAQVAEKKYHLAATRQDHLAARQNLRAQLARAYYRLVNSRRLVALYRDQLIPQAKKALVTAQERYRQGVNSYSSLLETTAVWLNFQLAQVRVETDYRQRLAQLEKLTGHSLDKLASPEKGGSK